MIDVRPIISKKDPGRLSEAQARGIETTIELEYRGAQVLLSTVRAPGVWGRGYIIRMEIRQPGIYSSQYFASTEDII